MIARISDYSEAIRINPKNAVYFADRGLTLLHQEELRPRHRRLHRGDQDQSAICGRLSTIAATPISAKEDYDRAIADYNEAIRINPKNAIANNNLGLAYFNKDDYDQAIESYSEAIKISPNYANAYDNRADTYAARGDFDRAIADYSEAIRVNPNRAVYLTDRGNAYLAKNDIEHALDRLQRRDQARSQGRLGVFVSRPDSTSITGRAPRRLSISLRPPTSIRRMRSNALWLDIIGQRNSLPSRLSEAAKQLDMTKWPGPIVRLYLGQFTPAAVLASIEESAGRTMKHQTCQANFYSGIWALRQNAKEEAARLFKLAVSDCYKISLEWRTALGELKALEVAASVTPPVTQSDAPTVAPSDTPSVTPSLFQLNRLQRSDSFSSLSCRLRLAPAAKRARDKRVHPLRHERFPD